MAGRVQWEAQVDSNVAKLLKETKELRDQLDGIKKGNYEIKLNIDNEKLEKVISNLDKMLNSLGKGTGDFKEFENLSKQLNEIVSEVKELNKAFGGINDSGVSNLLSSIRSIDKSLSSLSEHITNVNKDFGSVGKNASDNVGQINEAKKATEGLAEATKELANAQKNVGNKSNISSPIKDTFQDKNSSAVIEQQNEIQKELIETQEEAKKARDIISQVGQRKTYITKETDKNGNTVEHEVGQYSFVERLQDGQLQNVLVTYDEHTRRWTEETLSLSTAFEKVGNEIISLDNKINQYENARNKTLASHPNYDDSADNALISQTEKRRKILLDILALYDREGEYQYEISEFEKRRAENVERLKNVTKQQENLLDVKQSEKAVKETEKQSKAQQKKWQDFQKEQQDYISKQQETEAVERNKSAYQELLDTIKRYSEVSKRIAKNETLDGDLELAEKLENKISELQKNPILSSSQIAKSERELVDLYNQLDVLEKKTAKSQLDYMASSINDVQTQFDKYSAREDKSAEYIANLKNLETALDALKEKKRLLEQSPSSISNEEIKKFDDLKESAQNAIDVLKRMPAATKGSTDASREKEIDKLTKYLDKNTRISKEARQELERYLALLKSGDPSVNVQEIHTEWTKVAVAEREAGREGKSFFDIFKDKALYGYAAQLAGYFLSLGDFIRYGRQAIDTVVELNSNITELAKVSDATSSQIYDDFNSYAEIAKEVGGTISDTISATADWSRNGYNIPDSQELAEVAMIYKNVGDEIDIDQANEYLISTLRGFTLEAEDAMDIIDSINEVANNEPISASGIGDALQRSAAAFNAANTSLQESIALVTSTNSVLQSPDKVGSMWTTVSARIRGAKTELEDAGLETDGMVESTSKLQAMIKGMTGFDILEDDGKTFKSIYDIIVGIGDEFQNLSDLDQAALLEALAGGVILPENMETYLMNIFNCKVNLKLYATI